MVKSLDPTRPIMYQGDGDPDGAADAINLHYPHEMTGNWLFPNACDWVERRSRVGGWPRREWEWSGRKPLLIGEFLWAPAMSASVFTTFLGDDAYVDYSRARNRSKAIAWGMQIGAYRAADVAGTCPWTVWERGQFPPLLYEATARAYHPNAANLKEYDTRFYAGEHVQRTVNLYNNTLRPAELTLRWALADQEQGERTFAAEAGARIETEIALSMPEVDEPTAAPLKVTVERQGEVLFEETHDYRVFPRRAPAFDLPEDAAVAVYEGDGQVSEFLRSGGLEPVRIADLAELPGSGAGLLIIGAHALDQMPDEDRLPVSGGDLPPPLADFVREGGVVLTLEQASVPRRMLPAELSGPAATMAFKRSPYGGLLEGLDEDAFKFWRGDHLVTRCALARPREGAFRIFVDAGGPDGLDKVLLLEVPWGAGRYIMSQLLIGQKLGREPVADLLFERLVNYGARAAAPSLPAGLVCGERALDRDLRAVGARFEDLGGRLADADLGEYAALVLDASSEEVADARARLGEFVRAGGKVLLHGLSQDRLAALAGALPDGLTVRANTQTPVLLTCRDDEVTMGMTNEDLHWVFDHSGPWGRRLPLARDVLHGEVARRLPPLQECTVVEAAALTPADSSEEGPVLEGGELHVCRNGSAGVQVELPEAGRYFFGLVGRGTEVAGTFPQVAIDLAGRRLGLLSVADAESASFAVVADAEAGPHTLTLTFTNESWYSDRHLWLKKAFYAPCPAGAERELLRPAGLVKIEDGEGFWLIDQVAWDGRTRTYGKAARYLSGLLGNLGVAFEERRPWTTVLSSRRALGQTEQSGSQGQAISLGPGERTDAEVDFRRGGPHGFVLSARGTEAAGRFPLVRLLIDGEPAGEQRAQTAWAWHELAFVADVPEGVHRVGVEFAAEGAPEDAEGSRLSIRRLQVSP
jgi:hypothetical protein